MDQATETARDTAAIDALFFDSLKRLRDAALADPKRSFVARPSDHTPWKPPTKKKAYGARGEDLYIHGRRHVTHQIGVTDTSVHRTIHNEAGEEVGFQTEARTRD